MDAQNIIIGVVGRRGSGKSTVARKIVERCERIVQWDSMAEYGWIPNTLQSQEDLERFFGWASTRDLYATRYVPQGDLTEEFVQFAAAVYDQGDLMLGVEEVSSLCTPASLPPAFDRIVRLGRHRGISLVYTSQRMVEVARRLTAATDAFVIFSHREPRDLAGIAERLGDDVARRVAGLGRHDLICWDVVENQELKLDSLLQTVCDHHNRQHAVSL